MQRRQLITIPARKNAPATQIFVQMHYQTNRDLDIKPYLFILPGGPGFNHSDYLEFIHLQKIANVVFYDPRGCGKSHKGAADTYTLENCIEDLEVVRQSLGIQKIILAGYSNGGNIALGYTLRFPQSVEKLILIASPPSHRHYTTAYANVLRDGTNKQVEAFKKLTSGAFVSNRECLEIFDTLEPLYYAPANRNKILPPPGFITKVRQGLKNQRYYDFAYEVYKQGILNDLKYFDYLSELHTITCPTLIISGDSDWIIDVKYAKIMANKIPNNRLVIINNAGHYLIEEAPQLLFSSIEEFVKKEPTLQKTQEDKISVQKRKSDDLINGNSLSKNSLFLTRQANNKKIKTTLDKTEGLDIQKLNL